MFGLGRKLMLPEEFGAALISLTQDELSNTAARSLSFRFEDFDLSNGAIHYLQSKGVSVDNQLLYVRIFTHCCVQGATRNLAPAMSKTIVAGAMGGFVHEPPGYRFEAQSRALASSYFAYDDAETSALNAAYLVENFIDPILGIADVFWDDMDGYMAQVRVGIAVVERAATFVQKKFRLDGN